MQQMRVQIRTAEGEPAASILFLGVGFGAASFAPKKDAVNEGDVYLLQFVTVKNVYDVDLSDYSELV